MQMMTFRTFGTTGKRNNSTYPKENKLIFKKQQIFENIYDGLNRNHGTVSRHVREYEAAVSAASVVLKASQ